MYPWQDNWYADYVMVSIKLCKDGENDEYIILCNFGGRITSSFGVIEVDL